MANNNAISNGAISTHAVCNTVTPVSTQTGTIKENSNIAANNLKNTNQSVAKPQGFHNQKNLLRTKNANTSIQVAANTGNSSDPAFNGTTRISTSETLNFLLDPEVINDYPTQALLLTVLATLVRNSTDENEIRILYQYISEASIVFAKVFPVIHNLLDSKINHIIQLSLDESILDSVQSIIQNMISSCEMTDSYQQQLSYLQSCGFGGLWRFAKPFAIAKEKPENVELFVDCLEAMVETCLPTDDDSLSDGSFLNTGSNNGHTSSQSSQLNNQTSFSNLNQSVNNFINRSNVNLITGSMSSISMNSVHSPTDLVFEARELTRANNRLRRGSSPKLPF